MKQFIVFTAFILLGIFIFNCIVVGDDSIKYALGGLWEHEVTEQQSVYP